MPHRVGLGKLGLLAVLAGASLFFAAYAQAESRRMEWAVEAAGGAAFSQGETGTTLSGAILASLPWHGGDDGLGIYLRPEIAWQRFSVAAQTYNDLFITGALEVDLFDSERYNIPLPKELVPYAWVGSGLERLTPAYLGVGSGNSGPVFVVGSGLRWFFSRYGFAGISTSYGHAWGDAGQVKSSNVRVVGSVGLTYLRYR